MIRYRFPIFLVALAGALCAPAHGDINEPQFRKDLNAIAAEPRVIGSIGYQHAGRYIESQLQSLPGVEFRRHEFPVMVPVTQSAGLYIAGDPRPHPIYPFWPAQVRLCAAPEEGITG